MLRVEVSQDKVILDLLTKRTDILLSCSQANQLAESLMRAASIAELSPPSLVKGESWGMKIESFDGKVAIRVTPPLGSKTSIVPLPPEIARRVADTLKFKSQQAEHKLRILLSN